MEYENRGKVDFKKWDLNKKDETPEERLARMLDEYKTDMIRSGVMKSIKDHEFYIKPSQRKRMEIAESRMKAKQNQKRRNQGK